MIMSNACASCSITTVCTHVHNIMCSHVAVDIDVTSDTGQTSLLIASESGAEHAVEFLLLRKANCRLCDKCGQRPIHHAAAGSNVRIVRMLLEYDVDSASIVDNDGWTPLHHAAAVGFVECGECRVSTAHTLTSVQ